MLFTKVVKDKWEVINEKCEMNNAKCEMREVLHLTKKVKIWHAVERPDMIDDCIGKVAPPDFYGQLFNTSVRTDPNSKKVFYEELHIHWNIAPVELVVSLGYDSFFVEAVS